jgi:hypothetical protein
MFQLLFCCEDFGLGGAFLAAGMLLGGSRRIRWPNALIWAAFLYIISSVVESALGIVQPRRLLVAITLLGVSVPKGGQEGIFLSSIETMFRAVILANWMFYLAFARALPSLMLWAFCAGFSVTTLVRYLYGAAPIAEVLTILGYACLVLIVSQWFRIKDWVS